MKSHNIINQTIVCNRQTTVYNRMNKVIKKVTGSVRNNGNKKGSGLG